MSDQPAPTKTRKLKTYLTSVFISTPEIIEAIGGAPHIRQVDGLVAAENKKQAAALLGIRPTDVKYILDDGHDLAVIALASPGQTFATYGNRSIPPVKYGRDVSSFQTVLGAETDLDMARAILAEEQAGKDREIERRDEFRTKMAEAQDHRERNLRRVQQSIADNELAMTLMGFHPSTIAPGDRSVKGGNRAVGVLVPAEVYDELVRKAKVADDFGE